MPLARWVPVSEVRSDVRVRFGRPPSLAVCLLPLSGLGDGRDDTPQFEDPAHDVVLGCVSDDDGYAWAVGPPPAAATGTQPLRDRVDDAAQAPSRNGECGAGSASRGG